MSESPEVFVVHGNKGRTEGTEESTFCRVDTQVKLQVPRRTQRVPGCRPDTWLTSGVVVVSDLSPTGRTSGPGRG